MAECEENEKLTDKEVTKITLALSSLSTSDVIVCPTKATLYINPSDNDMWDYHRKGVPCLIVSRDSDELSHLHICLVERRTGLPLWREELTSSSNYNSSSQMKYFYTFRMTSEKLAGLSFPGPQVANMFAKGIAFCTRTLTQPAKTVSLQRRSTFNGIHKRDISAPCLFSHVTSASSSKSSRGIRRFKSMCEKKNRNIAPKPDNELLDKSKSNNNT